MKKKTKIVGLFLMITLLFFAIPGFGKVQASREDDVFDGWQELEDEAKKEEELEAQSNQTLEIGQSGEYTVSFRNAELKGREGSLAIVNKTGKPMRLDITETLARTSVSSPDNKLTDLQWNHNQGNKTLSGGGYLNPLASTRLDLKFRSDYQGGTYFVVKATISEVKDLGGKSFSQAQLIENTGKYTGSLLNNTSSNPGATRYFRFHVEKRRFVNIQLSRGEGSCACNQTLYLYSSAAEKDSLIRMYIYDATKREQILLEPGDYVIALWATNFYGGSTAVYDLELSGRDYIFATGGELTCREKTRTFTSAIGKKTVKLHLTATTIPANADDKLKEFVIKGSSASHFHYNDSSDQYATGLNRKTVTVSVTSKAVNYKTGGYYPGYAKVYATSSNGKASKPLDFTFKAAPPSVSNYQIYHNYVWFDSGYSSKAPVRFYQKVGNKWKLKTTVKKQNGFKLKGLKANTAYKFKLVALSKNSKGKWLEGSPKYLRFRTGRGERPDIRSIQVSNVKLNKKRKWEREAFGKWAWHTYYSTSYTITINLNRTLPGTLGLSLGWGQELPGKGTRFVLRTGVEGNWVGDSMKIRIRSYNQKGYKAGYGPIVERRVTIR